ncbi:MAG TPA: helix-turn-helix domain-containing protein [Candidatus Acidoferrales bacterium]
MAKGNFGEHLRREREMRGVSLDEIATATRISTRFLDALENEYWERLPGGVFNRGFVRAVAHYLGLDEENLLAEYAQATNTKPMVAVWVDNTPPKKNPARTWAGVAVLLALLAFAGWYLYDDVAPLVAAWRAPAPPPSAPPPTPAAGSAAAETAPATPQLLELKIDIGRPTRVTITADGATVFEGQLNSGESRKFQAKESFEVSVGNSSAVLLELNGQTVPPLASPGEPGRITLTHKDIKPTGDEE